MSAARKLQRISARSMGEALHTAAAARARAATTTPREDPAPATANGGDAPPIEVDAECMHLVQRLFSTLTAQAQQATDFPAQEQAPEWLSWFIANLSQRLVILFTMRKRRHRADGLMLARDSIAAMNTRAGQQVRSEREAGVAQGLAMALQATNEQIARYQQ